MKLSLADEEAGPLAAGFQARSRISALPGNWHGLQRASFAIL
jgi:hypothetical protein